MSSLNRHLLPPRTPDDLVPSPSSAPSWFGEATETVADLGVLVLVALCLGHGIRALRRGPVEERLLEVTGCPPVSDYAFPSNHATIAAALAAAAVLMAPRIWRLVVVLVATVGAARVLGGMHYLHDVLAGVLLGWALVSSAVHLLARRAAVALTRLATRSWAVRILPSWQQACRSEVERYTDRDGRA